ncbi:MAG: hypothetical protein ACRAVC_07645 [Trichormus sp.]
MGFFKWLITLPQTYSTKSRPRRTGFSTQIFDKLKVKVKIPANKSLSIIILLPKPQNIKYIYVMLKRSLLFFQKCDRQHWTIAIAKGESVTLTKD